MRKLLGKSMKENGKIIIIMTFLIIIFGCLDYFFQFQELITTNDFLRYLGLNHNSYLQGIITNIIGAIIVVLVIDTWVRERDEKTQRDNTIKQLENIDVLFYQYINNYIIYAKCITNPEHSQDIVLEKNFDFKRLVAIFNPTLFITDDNLGKKAFHYYFEAQENILDIIKSTIINIDFKNIKEIQGLQNLFLNYINNIGSQNLFDGINSDYTSVLLNPETKLETAKMKDSIIELIKNSDGAIMKDRCNSINLYVLLYHQINYNLDFIEQYNEYRSIFSQ